MHFVAGSHRLGHVSGESISDESDREITALIAERGPDRSRPTARWRAGDATFHAGWTLHSAGPNPTAAMRSVMTVIYVADGMVVATPGQPVPGVRPPGLAGRHPARLAGRQPAQPARLAP